MPQWPIAREAHGREGQAFPALFRRSSPRRPRRAQHEEAGHRYDASLCRGKVRGVVPPLPRRKKGQASTGEELRGSLALDISQGGRRARAREGAEGLGRKQQRLRPPADRQQRLLGFNPAGLPSPSKRPWGFPAGLSKLLGPGGWPCPGMMLWPQNPARFHGQDPPRPPGTCGHVQEPRWPPLEQPPAGLRGTDMASHRECPSHTSRRWPGIPTQSIQQKGRPNVRTRAGALRD